MLIACASASAPRAASEGDILSVTMPVDQPPRSGSRLAKATDSTPGRAASRRSSSSKNASRCGAPGYCEDGSFTRAATTCRVSNPRSTALSRDTLRRTSAAPTSRTRASATSAVSSRPRQRSTAREAWCPSPARSRSAGRARDACHAGSRPKRTPVVTLAASANPATRRSSAAASTRGVETGARAFSPDRSTRARTRPSVPPSPASSRLSSTRPVASRPRPAPRAEDTASSRWRPSARTTSRLATLRHAIASTAATAASISRSEPRTSRVTSRSSGETRAQQVAVGVGKLRARAAPTPPRPGRRASSAIAPGRRRPTRCVSWSPRFARRAAGNAAGTRNVTGRGEPRAPGATNPGGSTPTTR